VPRYEYKCKKCDRSFEVIHGVNDKVDECTYCGEEVRRVFHPVGIVFKGSGFYATDSRSSGNRAGKAAAAAEKPTEDSDSAEKPKTPEKKDSSGASDKPDKKDKPVKASQ
jgi:putative FmdB family regulatory protein